MKGKSYPLDTLNVLCYNVIIQERWHIIGETSGYDYSTPPMITEGFLNHLTVTYMIYTCETCGKELTFDEDIWCTTCEKSLDVCLKPQCVHA